MPPVAYAAPNADTPVQARYISCSDTDRDSHTQGVLLIAKDDSSCAEKDQAFNPPADEISKNRWIDTFLSALDKMKSLQKGWDTFSADPPTPGSINLMRTILETSEKCGLRPKTLTPVSDGGVGVTFKDEACWASVEVDNDEDIVIVRRRHQELPETFTPEIDETSISENIASLKRYFDDASGAIESERETSQTI